MPNLASFLPSVFSVKNGVNFHRGTANCTVSLENYYFQNILHSWTASLSALSCSYSQSGGEGWETAAQGTSIPLHGEKSLLSYEPEQISIKMGEGNILNFQIWFKKNSKEKKQ